LKKLITLAAALLLVAAGSAHAAAAGSMGGIGFRSLDGPSNTLVGSGLPISFTTSPAIGVRHWFSEKAGVDLAIGFTTLSVEVSPPTTKTDEGTGFVFDAGIPWALKKWEKVSFIFRPGVTYGTAEAKDKQTVTPPNKLTSSLLSVSGELEVEWMVTDRVSVSAAHGIAYRDVELKDNASPENKAKIKGWDTTGNNFTQLGFHVYLW
jgi:opacity protein-like surface antigen